MTDLIDRQAAIDALWKALFEYEDETEKQFQESEDLDVGDWIGHRIFVQNMSDIDRQTIISLPSAQPEPIKINIEDFNKEDWERLKKEWGNTPITVLPAQPERNTGTWIFVRGEEAGNALYMCSECGKGDIHAPEVRVSYCWNCGADMRGEQDE